MHEFYPVMFVIIGIIGFSNRKNDSHKQRELIFFFHFHKFCDTLKITPDIRLLQVYNGTTEIFFKKLYITENFYKHFIQFEDK